MTELFPEISETTRTITNYWIDEANKANSAVEAAKMLIKCRNGFTTESEKQFFDFALSLTFAKK